MKIRGRDAVDTGKELPIIAFSGRDEWARWLEENHASSPGVWLKLAKKDSGMASVSAPEVLEPCALLWLDRRSGRLTR